MSKLTLKDLKGKNKNPQRVVDADEFIDVKAQPLIDIIAAGDHMAYQKFITTGENRNLLLTLSKGLRAKAKELGELATAEIKLTSEQAIKAPETPVLSQTAMLYLAAAFDRLTKPLHPNFKKALKPKSLQMHEHIHQTAAKMADANKSSIKHAIVNTGRALTFDTQFYITYYKGLVTDACFAAHMDQLLLRKQSSPEDLNEGMDAMLDARSDAPPVNPKDAPVYDKSNALRNAEQEAYEGGEPREPIANSLDDVQDAVERLQAWIGLSVTSMETEQREFWGVDGLFPLCQRKSIDEFGNVYTPIFDFDDYCEYQTELFNAKQRTVSFAPDAADAMLR